jgi:hypothetical protein
MPGNKGEAMPMRLQAERKFRRSMVTGVLVLWVGSAFSNTIEDVALQSPLAPLT